MAAEPEHPVGLRAAALIVFALALLFAFLCYGRSGDAAPASRNGIPLDPETANSTRWGELE